jgi:serine/threonine protein kinase
MLTNELIPFQTNNNRVAQVIDKRRTAFKWGRYEWAVHVNQGIFSRVFTAKAPEENPDSFPGRPGDCVSLKVTYLAALVAPHNVEREARILRKAAGPNIITLWETFRDGAGHLVLVFPHMSYSLSQLIEQPEYPDAQRQSWLKDMFKGLAHIHSLGIIHRDIKPSNILLESITGPACLIDFGIAWCPGDPASEAPDKKITDVGTASYRPIEVLFGNQSYDTSLDLWAAGCVVAQVTCFSKKNLFTSGELGSELALILSIFKSLGTPSDADFQVCSKLSSIGRRTDSDRASKNSQTGASSNSTSFLQRHGLI